MCTTALAFQRFSEDADILANLTYLRERRARVGLETALEHVRRAVRGMLYADYA